jgi:cob(I)alamin adenosyltransferase
MVHTGAMRGKSTAAFGLALRAWAAGLSIGVYQFVKSGAWRPGEELALRTLGQAHDTTGAGAPVTWHTLGDGGSWTRRPADAADGAGDADAAVGAAGRAARALAGWRLVRRDLAEQRHSWYLLDELTYPMNWGWIDADEVVETLRDRPGPQHVIVTGRKADQRLIDAADLVVEMTKVKHPFDQGIRGQRGIEW